MAMHRHVKLPNGTIALVDAHGYVAQTIQVDLINADYEQVLDLISERATGSKCLSNVQYQVTGHCGNTLLLRVRDTLECISDVVELDESELTEQRHEVLVHRAGIGERTFQLMA
jgi:hypothetical protein